MTTQTDLSVSVLPGERTTVVNKRRAPFSWGWVWASFAGFLVFQVLLARFATPYITQGYQTAHFRFLVEGGINLAAYYLGGFLVGFISPKVRLLEPAVAAGLAMFAALSVGWFTPSVWYQFGMAKFLLGGGAAASLAYAGAFSAERLTGSVREDEF
ncbi:MAG: hypothetical protein KF760_28630 [Candidatus Eremiobacteraeota bacterium]|nr:hypothetical protein [Candidatus Eremiobacteraeota bacterium]MCW5865862.1 hypothetical protein [Candidatus Eremiobacteraeota bacterium]